MKKVYYLLLIIIISFGFSPKSYAYQLIGYKWAGGAYNYYINPIGVDNGVDYSSKSSTVINAAANWQSVSTTNVSLNYQGTTTNTGWGINDGVNVVTWKTNGWSGNVIGLSTSWYSGSQILDSDIKLNTAFANDSRMSQLVTHEVGHSLGIGHTQEQGATATQDEINAIMYWLLQSQTDLNQHDMCAITAIYPSSGSCSPTFASGYYDCLPCCSGGTFVSATISNNTYTYDGISKAVTVTTTPAGLTHTVTYTDASSNVVASPTNAGTYNVTVTISESGYESEGPFYGTLTINKKTLNVTAANKTVNYGDPQPAYTYTYSGFAGSESEANLTAAPNAFILQTWPVNPGTYTIYVNGGAANNYNFSYHNGTLTVNGLTLNQVFVSNYEQTYSGTSKQITVTTDPAGVGNIVTYKLNNVSVASPTNAGVYDVTITINEPGYAADKYLSTLTINKAGLQAKADNKSMSLGDLEPTYTITYNGFVNSETVNVLDTKPVAQVVGTRPLPAGTYTIEVTGGSDNNYSITRMNGTLTVAGNTADSVKFANIEYNYDGLPHYPTISTYPANLSYDEIFINEHNYQVGAPVDAGTYTIDVIINEPGYVKDTFSTYFYIEKVDLEIKANDTTVVFGAPEPDYTLSYNGFVNGENKNFIDWLPQAHLNLSWPQLPGEYTIELLNGDDNNYNLILKPGKLTVKKAKVDSVTFLHNEFTYDGIHHEATITSYPKPVNLSVSYFDSLNYKVYSPYNAGTFRIETIVNEPGYVADTFINRLIIKKAPLTLTAMNDTIEYGDMEPKYQIGYDGFIAPDNEFAIDFPPIAGIEGDWPVLPGEYEIGFSEGWDNNYELITKNGILVVQSQKASILISDTIKAYNGLPQEAIINIVPDFIANEITYTDEFGNNIGMPRNAGKYKLKVLITEPGFDSISRASSFTILPDTLLVSVHDQTITFGEPIPELTYTINGFIDSEDESVVFIKPQLTIHSESGLLPGEYEIKAQGAEAFNYNFKYKSGKLVIHPIEAQITAITDTVTTYTGLPQQISVFTNPEFVSYSVNYIDEHNFPTEFPTNAGTYAYSVSINEIGYSPIKVTGHLKINQADLYVSADTIEINYGEELPTNELKYKGFVGGESIWALFVQPSIEETTGWPLDAGTYELNISGGESENYHFSYSPFVIKINPAILTVTADNFSITYGDALPELAYSISGFHYGEGLWTLNTLPQLNIEGTMPLVPGNHSIVASGAAAANYTFEYHNGTLTIAPIGSGSFTATQLETVYTGKQQEITIVTDPADLAYSANYSETPINAGIYNVHVQITEPGYLPMAQTFEMKIKKAKLQATVADETVLLGDDEPEYKINYEGLVNDETTDVIDQMPVAKVSANWAEIEAGTHSILISEGFDNNYEFSYTNGTLTVVQTYLIQVKSGENGKIARTGDATMKASFEERVAENGTSAEYTGVANEGYIFNGWDDGSTTNPITFKNVTKNITLTAKFEKKVGISELTTNNLQLKLYPNPVEALHPFNIQVEMPEQQYSGSKIVVTDMVGRIIFVRNEVKAVNQIKGLKRGIYTINVQTEKGEQQHMRLLVL